LLGWSRRGPVLSSTRAIVFETRRAAVYDAPRMSGLQAAIGLVAIIVETALLAGLFWRGHHRREPFFVLFIAGVVVTNAALGLWYRADVWLVQQAVTAGLRFGVALGLGANVFRNFPAAAVTARRLAFVVLAVTLVALLALPTGQASYTQLVGVIVPRIANGTVWLFTALAALVLWYRLPLTGLQKAILVGYAPYLLVFTVSMNLLASVGWQIRERLGYADTLAYFALMAYWCGVAWRVEGREPILPRPGALSALAVPVEHAS
jgi:hypothetical protein